VEYGYGPAAMSDVVNKQGRSRVNIRSMLRNFDFIILPVKTGYTSLLFVFGGSIGKKFYLTGATSFQ